MEERLKEQLKQEGFSFVYEWHDTPGKVYPLHEHQNKVAIIVVHGEVAFDFGGEKKVVRKGERFDVPPKTKHTAVVGKDGCDFIVGEVVENDA